MLLWIVFGVMTLAALFALLGPLLGKARDGASRADYGIEVYRRQIRELEDERARGLLTEAELEAARTEIQRRMLRAADQDGQVAAGGGGRRLRLAAVLALILLLPIGAGGLYQYLGRPDLPALPLSARDLSAERARLAEKENMREQVAGMIGRLTEKLKENPQDLQGWVMLGRAYGEMGRFNDAVNAYRTAVEIDRANADLRIALAESLVFAAEGMITPEAVENFQSALEIEAGHPGARFYLGLARYQARDVQGAFDRWIELYGDSPADAPWINVLRARLAKAADELGLDLAAHLPEPQPAVSEAAPAGPFAGAPGPSRGDVAAAQNMSEGDRNDMIRSMVDRLAGKMAEAPTYEGLMRLGRAYGVLKENEAAAEAFASAARLQPDDLDALAAQAGALMATATSPGQLPPEAVAVYRRILEIEPDFGDALWYVGIAEAVAGNKAKAVEHWQRLLLLLEPESKAYRNVSAAIRTLGG